jgi:hypothetical protein
MAREGNLRCDSRRTHQCDDRTKEAIECPQRRSPS